MIKKYIKKITTFTYLSQSEAWWLLEAITKKKQAQLRTDSTLLKKEILKLNKAIIKLKKTNIPLAYLIGSVPFLNITIQVKKPILIPRPETEEWVEQLIEQLKPHENKIKKILDIGTGSGCIALSLASRFPLTHIFATDINSKALLLAQKNAAFNNITNITFIKSNLFEKIKKTIIFDLIVSNPPYIDPEDKSNMSAQVLNWEDHQALFAQNQGKMIIEQIIKQAPDYLSSAELPFNLVLEIDSKSAHQINSFAQKSGFSSCLKTDAFGKLRTFWAKK